MPKVDDTPDNEKICRNFCGSCPTFPDTGDLLFCAKGKSNNPNKEMGCNCGACTIWNNYGLKDFYYCIKGAAK